MSGPEVPDTLPWRTLFGIAVGVLALPPDAFYGMTPGEFWASFEAYSQSKGWVAPLDPLSRDELSKLMETFPDGKIG